MSSLLRRMQRKARRRYGSYEPSDQPTKALEDGGYLTLRPTKGWIRFSMRRLWAQMKVAEMLDRVLPDRRRKPRKLWRQPAVVPPPSETRQQRRADARAKRKRK